MASSVEEIKKTIIASSIEQDQHRVAKMWLNTFKQQQNVATEMAKLILACIAQGDFQVNSQLVNDNSTPSKWLATVDYISHASRIILDYQDLSPEHQKELKEFFPQPSETNGVFSRSATHAAIRQGDEVKELKGFIYGAFGQVPTLLKQAYDFGVNIAMGGEGQKNFIGKTITANGYSGHMYFHHYPYDAILMVGLEQSAPAASIGDMLWGHGACNHEAIQSESDQFGQGHSLVGASDTFTAAGSLYFSDPVYQAKLLAERGIAPPNKYGGMKVKLTNENWRQIKQYLTDLTQADDSTVLNQLMQPPKTANHDKQDIISFIALDFKTYFERIDCLIDSKDEDFLAQHRVKVDELLSTIKALQTGDIIQLACFLEQIGTMMGEHRLPQTYREAIQRIQTLFDKQLEIDKHLQDTRSEILIQKKTESLLQQVMHLDEQIQLLLSYFNSENLIQDEYISLFLAQLDKKSAELTRIRHQLSSEQNEEVSNSLVMQSSILFDSSNWLVLNETLDLDTLESYQQQVNQIADFLSQSPKLCSQQTLLKQQSDNQEDKERIQQLTVTNQSLAHECVCHKEQNESLESEKNELQSQLIEQTRCTQQKEQAIQLLATKNDELEKALQVQQNIPIAPVDSFAANVNSEQEVRYEALCNHLRKITQQYKHHLPAQEAASGKLEKVKQLEATLNDYTYVPLPSMRVNQFYQTLERYANDLSLHQSSKARRYAKNCVFAAFCTVGTLATGIVPGILLGLYANNTPGSRLKFWCSHGESFCEEARSVSPRVSIKA